MKSNEDDGHGIEMKVTESDHQDFEIQKAQIASDQLDEDEVKIKQEVRKKPDKMSFATGKSLGKDGLPDVQID